MTTVEALQALLDEIEALVEVADLPCPVDSFRITGGQPAAPSGQCTVVSVWSSGAFNAATSLIHEDNLCMIVRGVQLHWRVDVCYTETEGDRTAAQHLENAECLYGLADLIWCGLNASLQSIFEMKCSDIQVDPLTVNEAQGGHTSAESGLRLQLDCPSAEPES